jgi:hypothetical protein
MELNEVVINFVIIGIWQNHIKVVAAIKVLLQLNLLAISYVMGTNNESHSNQNRRNPG